MTKTPATLQREADAAFQKKDYRTGMLVLGQLVTAAPKDAGELVAAGAHHAPNPHARCA